MAIYLVRHGETEENLQRILQGHLPGVLTEQGRAQVRRAVEQLAQCGLQARCIVSSDLARAMESAEILARPLGLPIVSTPLLRERDWGPYTGMTVAEAAQRFRKHGKWKFPPDTVETEAALFARAGEALHKLREDYPRQDVVVVTHGLFARNLIAAHLGKQFREIPPLTNAAIVVLADEPVPSAECLSPIDTPQ